MAEQGNGLIVLTSSDKFAELHDVTAWFREKPYKVRAITIQPAPAWMNEDDSVPQSIIELELKDHGLRHHVEQYLECTSELKSIAGYIDIVANCINQQLKIKNALIVHVSEVSCTALGRKITKISGGSFEIWSPPNAELLRMLDKDPTLARFLELMEE